MAFRNIQDTINRHVELTRMYNTLQYGRRSPGGRVIPPPPAKGIVDAAIECLVRDEHNTRSLLASRKAGEFGLQTMRFSEVGLQQAYSSIEMGLLGLGHENNDTLIGARFYRYGA